MLTRLNAVIIGGVVLFLLGAMACSDSKGTNDQDATISAVGDGSILDWDSFGPDGPVCGYVKVSLSKQIPTVTLLIDRSSTMGESFSADMTRWDAVYETLMAQGDSPGLVKRLESQVRFGLTLYSSYADAAQCPSLDQVAPDLNAFDTLNDMYANIEAPVNWRELPASQWRNTPTGESVQQVHAQLAALSGEETRAIVLATDGLPDTCADPEADYGTLREKRAAQQVVLDAVSAAYADGIRTFVIGVGPDIAEDHLQEVANVGAGYEADAASSATYFVALTPSELAQAFGTILGSVTDCSFKLQQPLSDLGYADIGTVTIDGKTVEHGTDWRLVDVETLEILGDSCEKLLSGTVESVEASWPCRALIY